MGVVHACDASDEEVHFVFVMPVVSVALAVLVMPMTKQFYMNIFTHFTVYHTIWHILKVGFSNNCIIPNLTTQPKIQRHIDTSSH